MVRQHRLDYLCAQSFGSILNMAPSTTPSKRSRKQAGGDHKHLQDIYQTWTGLFQAVTQSRQTYKLDSANRLTMKTEKGRIIVQIVFLPIVLSSVAASSKPVALSNDFRAMLRSSEFQKTRSRRTAAIQPITGDNAAEHIISRVFDYGIVSAQF